MAEIPPRELQAVIGAGATHLVRLLPEAIGRLLHVDRARPPVLPGARLALFEAVTDLLRRRAADQGLVLALEDLHVADDASLRLLRFVVDALPSLPVLVVATYRDAEVPGDRHEWLSTLSRHGRRMRLVGLDEDGAAELLGRTLGEPWAAGLARSVMYASDGNPFVVQEIGRLLLAERHSADSANPEAPSPALPHDVRQLLRRRLAAAPDVREVIELAAVLGGPFDLTTIAALHEGDTEALVEVLGRAVDLGFLLRSSDDRWTFSHALVRDAVYEELRPSARVSRHRRAGRALESLGPAGRSSDAFQLAHHFFEAARAGDGAEAVEYSMMAGDEAVVALAFEEAARFYGQALEALSLAPPVDQHRRYRILAALATCQAHAGDAHHAAETWRRALASARALGAGAVLAEAALGYAATQAPGAPDTRAVLDEARAALALDDTPLLARLLVRAGTETSGQNRQFGREVSGQGVAMARRLGDPETLWAVLSDWHDAASLDPELVDERLEVARELLDHAERAGDPERVGLARLWLAADLFAAGDTTEAAAALDAAERQARAVRSPFLVWRAVAQRAGVALLEGRLDEAERLAAEAWATGRPLDLPEAERCWNDQMRTVALERGRFDDVAERARGWVDRMAAPQGSKVECARAHLALSAHHLGRDDEARSLLHDMLPIPGPRDRSVPPARLCCFLSAAELCWLLGDSERATLLAEVLARFDDLHVVVAGSHCSLGASSRYLAQLATLRNRMDEADAGFEAAEARHEQLGAPGWLARSRADHAAMLVRRGRPADVDRARSLAQAAAEAFAALGMGFYASTAAAMVGGGPPAAAGDPTPALDRAGLGRDGDYWWFRYGPAIVRLRDGKGVRYLVALLRAPGRELHALDLVGESGAAAGAVLDPAAKAAYRRRLEDLREELDDATADNDLERASRAQEGIDGLMAEISAAVDGGRGRAAADTERARQSVTRAVKATVERLAEANPDLGRHLRSTVRTGVYSTYAPDPRAPIVWEDE